MPNLPIWSWLIIALIGAITIILPFWMLWRIPVYRKIAKIAKTKGPFMHSMFWLLFTGSYLLVIWVVVWLYFKGV